MDRTVRGRVKMPEDIKYNGQVLIKSKIIRYFDIFPWFLVDIFTKNPNYYFYFVHPFRKSGELVKFWWFLNRIWETEFWVKNRHRRLSDSLEIRDFGPKVLRLLSVRPSTGGVKMGLTLKKDILIHRKVMDEPFWGSAKIMIKITFCFKKWPFVTTPVDFYVNFPENHDFDDLDKGVMDILNLMCSDGPERWLGPKNGLERDPECSRSNMRSKRSKYHTTGIYT